jgi:hypothetical protein
MLQASARTRKFKGVEERKGGDCRDPTPKNMGKLMLLQSPVFTAKIKGGGL